MKFTAEVVYGFLGMTCRRIKLLEGTGVPFGQRSIVTCLSSSRDIHLAKWHTLWRLSSAAMLSYNFFQFLKESIKCSWTATVERPQVSYNAWLPREMSRILSWTIGLGWLLASDVISWYMKLENAGKTLAMLLILGLNSALIDLVWNFDQHFRNWPILSNTY